MRPCGLMVIVIAWAVLTSGAAHATTRPSSAPTCHARGVTLLANERVRVYRGRILQGARTYYYCDQRTRRTRTLGEYVYDSGGGIRRIALAGRYIAYDYLVCTHGGCSASTRLLDARTRRLRRFEAKPDPVTPQIGLNSAASLVVTPAGSVAWIRSRPTDGATRINDVFVAPHGEQARLLDSGPKVEADSLAFGGGILYWTNDAAPRSAAVR
ncbi:hypothetical protein Cwoe_1181 [Conexibacter woesei DSM 14684]|uniref:Uncharacterized protein n=1 Tax=Conexibacter woesei (strain DSM 14684 / CCUG 47730 / CIP 108061 / JCM 11494 / NBRC 100937 / ID131577) TaxID=469383 RepID=D3FDN8_CONWI|nr:hypothetical protein Cwoe_1181 [Conexibacter woesei DSM 14684]